MNEIEARFAGRVGDFRLDVAFTVPARGVTALFGPSGCGKTTVLRCIAGLNRMKTGDLKVLGHVWQDEKTFVPPHRRPLGYVFQEASLFAHLSVRGNMNFGRKRNRSNDKAPAFDDVVSLLGIGHLLDRSTARLSGGERQRVAIARALLSGPRMLLMDEPLAALDAASKEEILPYLEALHNSLAIPTFYVSHDMAEVERLADHIVVLKDGKEMTCCSLAAFMRRNAAPDSEEGGTVLPARIAGPTDEDGLTPVEVDGGRFWIAGADQTPGSRLRISIPAAGVALFEQPPGRGSVLNVLPARIADVRSAGPAMTFVSLRLGADGRGAALYAYVTRRSARDLDLAPGKVMHAAVKAVAVADRGGAILA